MEHPPTLCGHVRNDLAVGPVASWIATENWTRSNNTFNNYHLLEVTGHRQNNYINKVLQEDAPSLLTVFNTAEVEPNTEQQGQSRLVGCSESI